MLYGIGIYGQAFTNTSAKPADIVYWDAFVSIPAFLGVVFFAYRHSLWHIWFWRLYGPSIVFWDIGLGLVRNTELGLGFWAHYGLLLPLYYGVVRMGYDREIWMKKDGTP